MDISLRSRLIAGTAAVATASAVAVSGVTTAGVDLPVVRVWAPDIELAALANPVLAVFDTIEKTNLYLFSIAEPPTTQFDRAGIIPDFLAAGFPILTQYFLNAPDYVGTTVDYLFADYGGTRPTGTYPGALRILTWAVDAIPANIGYAAQQVFSGNLVGALQTLQFAFVNPVQAALYQTLNAGLYAIGGVGTRAAAVATAIADWIPTTIRNLADDVTVVLNAAGSVLGNVAYGLQTGNPEVIWNSLVTGLLGTVPNPAFPTIPDALINQTIGEGGRIYTVPGSPTYLEIPSMRQNLTDLRDSITDALATDVPLPAEPPFPVSFPPLRSQLPTPWQQTPVPPVATPVAAAAVTQRISRSASSERASSGESAATTPKVSRRAAAAR